MDALRARPSILLSLLLLASATGCRKIRPDAEWKTEKLIEALEHRDVAVRERAVKYLGKRKAKAALWPLVRALGALKAAARSDTHASVRASAERAVSRIR